MGDWTYLQVSVKEFKKNERTEVCAMINTCYECNDYGTFRSYTGATTMCLGAQDTGLATLTSPFHGTVKTIEFHDDPMSE